MSKGRLNMVDDTGGHQAYSALVWSLSRAFVRAYEQGAPDSLTGVELAGETALATVLEHPGSDLVCTDPEHVLPPLRGPRKAV